MPDLRGGGMVGSVKQVVESYPVGCNTLQNYLYIKQQMALYAYTLGRISLHVFYYIIVDACTHYMRYK